MQKGTKKQLRKEKQQLVLKLLSLYEEHESITDHVGGEASDCLVCQNIQAWKVIIAQLDAQLLVIESEIKEANKPKKAERTSKVKNSKLGETNTQTEIKK